MVQYNIAERKGIKIGMIIRKTLGYFLILWIGLITIVNAHADTTQKSASNAAKPYQVAVLSFRAKEATQQRWQPLIDYLQQQLPGISLELKVFFYQELDVAVQNKEVDFILTQPAHYVLLTYSNHLSSPLASLINLEGDFATEKFGGVIFTKADNNNINDLKQIKGKSIATSDKESLGSYQMQAFELLQQGIRLPKDAIIIETGQPQTLAVDLVLAGKADIGFVRTGVLEHMAKNGRLEWHQIKLIGAQKFANFPFLTSTRLYPEWPFVAMPHVDKQLSAKLTSILLTIPHYSALTQQLSIAGFTIPGDYRTVDNLMRELRIEPFDDPLVVTLEDIYHQWSAQFIVLTIVLLFILMSLIVLLYRRNLSIIKAKHYLQVSNEALRQLKLAVEQSPESIVITDLKGNITYANPAVEHITGYHIKELLGRNPRILQSGKTEHYLYQQLWACLTTGQIWQGEILNKHKSGADYFVHMVISPVKNDQGIPTAYLAIQRDISTQKNDEQRIHQLLYIDSLTGLGNRSMLIDTLDKRFKNQQQGIIGYLLLLNVDRFKWVNAIHGVGFGDQLLIALAERLNTFIGDAGIVVRMEGDKFAILLTTSEQWRKDENWLLGWESALHSLINTVFKLGDERIGIHCSMGISQIIVDTTQSSIDMINTTIAQASTALKLAQKQGGNRIERFKASMAEQDLERHTVETELITALKYNELRLFLQSQVDQDAKVVGAEALIRWLHPVKGLLAPAAFIGIAEQSDLIIKIGHWVLQESCRLLAKAQQAKLNLTVSVNISPRHFLQPDFVDTTRAIVQAHQVKPEYLVLEITESLFMENLDEVMQKMIQLKTMGFSFSIDDFGTGYSSLSYLKQLPVDELKIDRAFITAMSKEGLSQSLVETIYVVASKMRLRVVAEGVEVEEQVAQLRALPNIIQQGYFYSKPEDGDRWLASQISKNKT
jgi:PAS domain S-box-containing protein/diguanylate cyclase (GGDEF)-like protein